ncbi:hypothetical protein HY374_04025 [Candidatus Berkelbacteria bacterium]|nr:hypothetical protein [Candidatus Berkelbacteria bacterium]
MHRLRTFFVTDWLAKLLCLFIAVLLWVGVISAEQRVGVFPGELPITVTNVPEGLSPVIDDREVKVTLLADQSIWQRLGTDDLRAEVNAAGLAAGVTELAVVVTSRVSGVEITRVEPPRVLVRLEAIVEKTVPVSVQLDGQAASGFASGLPSVEPAQVTVRGPASRLAQIDEALVRVTLDTAQRSVTAEATVSVLIAGEAPPGVSVSPSRVNVTVPIARAGNTKTVGVVLATVGSLPSGRTISAVQLTPSVISLTGSPAALGSVTHVSTIPIQLADIQDSTEVVTSLVLPEGVQLIDTSPEVTVRLTVEASPPPESTPTVDN